MVGCPEEAGTHLNCVTSFLSEPKRESAGSDDQIAPFLSVEL